MRHFFLALFLLASSSNPPPDLLDELRKLQPLTGQPLWDGRGEYYYALDFWASWCSPCQQSIPHYNKLQSAYKDKVKFIAISADDTKDEALAFAKKIKFNFPVLWDENREITKKFQIQEIPTLIIMDKRLKEIKRYRGYTEKKAIELENFFSEKFK
ncbi:MAG: TlpA family protein disulfide reductase [Bdellovibrionaceae bacterium]|nr:TlpA family protein disulfide reductase [Pseudobdellovibrionaceae bacterium]